ncbi:MAG: imidazole glycerol phosphate synthase subunit HisH [Acidobacteriota bacterium]|jgi:glutamine amidotransferase
MMKIVDYGLGNIRAFLAAYKKLGIPISTASTPAELAGSTRIILPGVGSFDNAMARLEESGLRESLNRLVLVENVPVLGVCVGMQMLAQRSEEGLLGGLGWIAGEVKKFSSVAGGRLRRVPHMGWNEARLVRPNKLFDGLAGARFYFLHSFYLECHKDSDILAVTDYDGDFVCGISSGNVFGVQFHPEKSHQWGSHLLENFANL